jgi:two-component system, NarL family, sensor histidine kinase YdfH
MKRRLIKKSARQPQPTHTLIVHSADYSNLKRHTASPKNNAAKPHNTIAGTTTDAIPNPHDAIRPVRKDSVLPRDDLGRRSRYNGTIMAHPNRLQRLWQTVIGHPDEDARRVWPFFIMLTVAMLFIYGWSVNDSPRLQFSPALLVAFTGLMIIYVMMFWLSPRWAERRPQAVIYLVVQGALAFTLVMIVQNVAMIFGVFAALVGVSVGMLGRTRSLVVAIGLEMGLSALCFVLIEGSVSLGVWLLGTGPAVVFIVIYVTMYVREIEARSRAQTLAQELEAANRQLTEYAAEVEDLTLASERQRMARELHDTLAQGLAGLVLQLEAIDSHLSRGNTTKAQIITQQAMERARSTLADARRAIDDLRSGDVPDIDLETAIREETDRLTVASGIPCELSIMSPPELPEEVRACALRVVSEALTNIARHAQAQHVAVSLRSIPYPHSGGTAGCRSLDIEVRDDGVGFDLAQIGAGHYGLIGLRERVRLIGGTLNIESAPGQGTTLKVHLPLAVSSWLLVRHHSP